MTRRPGQADRARRPRGLRAGLSVMETLVAVALIAVALIPLLALQRTLADAAFRIETAAEALEVQDSALAYLDTVNPMETPSGEFALGDWTMRWESRELAADPRPQGYLGGRGFFELALYEVEVSLARGPRERRFQVRKLGWRLREDVDLSP